MEWVWGRVRKLGGDRRATYYEGRKVTPEEDVARVAGLAFPGPLTKTELMTPAEFDRWVSRVQKTAGRLAQLVQATNLDSYVRRDHYLRYRDLERRGALGMYVAQREMKGGVEDYLPLPKDDWSVFTRCERQYKPPPLSELLRRLAREVEKADTRLFGVLDFKLFNFDGNGRHGMSKPRHPQARRQFFVRALTSFCQERLGGKQRRIVADVTSVAFQSDISQREIIRLSP